MNERTVTHCLQEEGQKVSQSQCKNRTRSNSTISRAVQESLTGCSCPLTTRRSSCSFLPQPLSHQPADVAKQWLRSSFSLGSLPWSGVHQSTGTVLPAQERGTRTRESPDGTVTNLTFFSFPWWQGKKQVPVKGVESTNSCNPLTCPLKLATSHQLI